jgi:hypothetical protein
LEVGTEFYVLFKCHLPVVGAGTEKARVRKDNRRVESKEKNHGKK